MFRVRRAGARAAMLVRQSDEDDPCCERIPGERNMKCWLAQATGREQITQLMVEEYRRAKQWHDGIDFI